TGLIVAGVIAGWLTPGAGLLAFFTVPAHTPRAHVEMYWHLALAASSMGLFTVGAVARWRPRAYPPPPGVPLIGLLAPLLLGAAGFLGGGIVYRGGAGIDPAVLSPEISGGHHHEHH